MAERMLPPGAVISGFIRLLPSTRDRATVVKRSDTIVPDQGPHRVCRLINGGRNFDTGTARALIPCCYHHHDAGRKLGFNGGLELAGEQPSEGTLLQELLVISGALVGSPSPGSPPTG